MDVLRVLFVETVTLEQIGRDLTIMSWQSGLVLGVAVSVASTVIQTARDLNATDERTRIYAESNGMTNGEVANRNDRKGYTDDKVWKPVQSILWDVINQSSEISSGNGRQPYRLPSRNIHNVGAEDCSHFCQVSSE